MENKMNLHFRFANENDSKLYFDWANDELVRENSFNKEPILHENHVKWFQSKLQSKDCFFYLFLNDENKPVGQVRIDKGGDEIIIGISIDKNFRGQSLGGILLEMASDDYLSKHPTATILAYIKKENTASLNIFMKAGFTNKETVIAHNSESYKLYKTLK